MMRRRHALSLLVGALRADKPQCGRKLPSASLGDWSSVLAIANRHFLTPAVYAAACKSGDLRSLPLEVRRYFALVYRLNRLRNRAIREQALELVRALNESGVEPMLLKGALFLVTDGPFDPAARMMADIDVMVRRDGAGPTLATLDRLGYTIRNRYPDGHHAFGEFTRDADPAAVDLHFELIEEANVLPAEEVWRRGRNLQIEDSVSCFVPGPTDRLFHHLLHAQIHHRGRFYRGTVDLQQLYEFACLAGDVAHPVDWTFIRERMRRHQLLTPLYSYMRMSEVFFGTARRFPVPLPWPTRLHVWRCGLQLRYPILYWFAVPWGNVRAAFAWHRMQRLYSDRGVRESFWRLHHFGRVLRHHSLGFAFTRLFRL